MLPCIAAAVVLHQNFDSGVIKNARRPSARVVFTILPQKVQFRGLIENTKFMNVEHTYKCYRSSTKLL